MGLYLEEKYAPILNGYIRLFFFVQYVLKTKAFFLKFYLKKPSHKSHCSFKVPHLSDDPHHLGSTHGILLASNLAVVTFLRLEIALSLVFPVVFAFHH